MPSTQAGEHRPVASSVIGPAAAPRSRDQRPRLPDPGTGPSCPAPLPVGNRVGVGGVGAGIWPGERVWRTLRAGPAARTPGNHHPAGGSGTHRHDVTSHNGTGDDGTGDDGTGDEGTGDDGTGRDVTGHDEHDGLAAKVAGHDPGASRGRPSGSVVPARTGQSSGGGKPSRGGRCFFTSIPLR